MGFTELPEQATRYLDLMDAAQAARTAIGAWNLHSSTTEVIFRFWPTDASAPRGLVLEIRSQGKSRGFFNDGRDGGPWPWPPVWPYRPS
jgi:hypothetical protein